MIATGFFEKLTDKLRPTSVDLGLALALILQPSLAGCQDIHTSSKYACGIFNKKTVRIPANQVFMILDYENPSDDQYWWDCENPRKIRAINLIYKSAGVMPMTNSDWKQYFKDGNDIRISPWKNWIDLNIEENRIKDIDTAINNQFTDMPWGKYYKYAGKSEGLIHYRISGYLPKLDKTILQRDLYYDRFKTKYITCEHSRREIIDHADISMCSLNFYNRDFDAKIEVHFYGLDIAKTDFIMLRLNSLFRAMIINQGAV